MSAFYPYRAFISYSHRDKAWCDWLHGSLERYLIDTDIAGRITAAGPVPRHLRPVFRDRADFTAGPLRAQTIDALKQSQFLIVIASPNSAASAYVDEEIRLFKSFGGEDRVLSVIVGGEAPACFAPALRFRVGPEGALTDEPADQVGADVALDGKREALTKLVSKLVDLPYDILWQREVKAARKRVFAGAAAIVAVAVLAIAAGVFGWEHIGTKTEIEAQRATNVEQDDKIRKLTAAVLAMSRAQAAPGQEKEVQAAIAGIVERARAGDARLREAEKLLAAGKIDDATALLATEAREKGAETRDKAKEAAAAWRRLGAIAGLRDPQAAREASAKAVVLDPDNADGLALDGWFQLQAKNLAASEKSYRALLSMAGKGASDDQLFWARTGLGDIAVARGDLAGAQIFYREAESAMQRLAQLDAGNADWQRDLSLSQIKIGNVLVSQGHLAEALISYRSSLAIAERLAQSDAEDAVWQRDLSLSQNKIGDVLVRQGNLDAALIYYRSGLAIAERLAQSDAGNSDWRRDLFVSLSKIGNVLVSQGHLAEALISHRSGLAIAERLAQSDAGNAGWQRDLSVSMNNIGDVLVKQGNLPDALTSYRSGFAIRERLAKSDAGNADWQRDLSASLSKLGSVYFELKEKAQARDALTRGREIIAELVKKYPDWAEWKQDLGWFERKLAALDAVPAGGGATPGADRRHKAPDERRRGSGMKPAR